MDVLRVIFICSLFAAALTQEEEFDDNSLDITTRKPTVTTLSPLNCTTAHSLEGVCTARTSCDYGTPVVDLTLYKPSWYKSLCAMEEVCCPFDSVLPPPSGPTPEDGAGGVGQDDDDNF